MFYSGPWVLLICRATRRLAACSPCGKMLWQRWSGPCRHILTTHSASPFCSRPRRRCVTLASTGRLERKARFLLGSLQQRWPNLSLSWNYPQVYSLDVACFTVHPDLLMSSPFSPPLPKDHAPRCSGSGTRFRSAHVSVLKWESFSD